MKLLPTSVTANGKGREIAIVVTLFLLILATRAPLRGRSLEEIDSANYALAINDLDVGRHQPQPPGYILFIGTARLFYLWTDSEVGALTAVNALFGSLSIALLYVLLRHGLPAGLALASALLAAFSPQVWFQQVRPLEDAFAFFWMLLAACLMVFSKSSSPFRTMARACRTMG